MVEVFAEKKAAEKGVEKPPELYSKVISRGPVELYSPLNALDRSATNMRIPSESTYHSVSTADLSLRIAKNVQSLRIGEGTTSLPERFFKLLQNI